MCRPCTCHRHDPPEPLEVPSECPKCHKPLAENEWHAYGRCENCWVGDSPTSTYAGPKVFRDMFRSYDTGGGERSGGQRLKLGKLEFLDPQIHKKKKGKVMAV